MNGKVDGDKVTFTETLSVMDMMIDVACTGTVVSADEITFSRDRLGTQDRAQSAGELGARSVTADPPPRRISSGR